MFILQTVVANVNDDVGKAMSDLVDVGKAMSDLAKVLLNKAGVLGIGDEVMDGKCIDSGGLLSLSPSSFLFLFFVLISFLGTNVR